MEKMHLEAEVMVSHFCCGLFEVGNLEVSDYEGHTEPEIKEQNKRSALFATTVPSQKEEIQRLKALDFRKVTTWRNPSTRRQVTLWFKKPKGQRW